MKKEKLKTSDANQVAQLIIGPIIQTLDMALQTKPEFIEIMEKQVEAMEDQTGYLAAWPFPETMDKADERKIQDKTFRAIIKLAKIRKEFIKFVMEKKQTTPGQDILKHMGF